MPRDLLTALLLVTACGATASEAAAPDVPLRHSGGARGRMDFSPPKDETGELWCEDDALPETKAGAGACFRDAVECSRRSEHLWTQYRKPGRVPPCTKRDRAHCFDMVSRGETFEVCRSTAAGCTEHHRIQTRDAWVEAITDGCEERLP